MKRYEQIKFAFQKQGIYFFFLSFCMAACSSPSDELKPNTPLGNFEALWEIIDTKYCYLDEKNIDWEGVKELYQPAAEALESDDYRGLFDLLATMLDTLQDGHVNLYSDFDISRNRMWYDSYPQNYDASVVYGDRYLGKDYKIAGGLYYQYIANNKVGYVRYESFSNSFSGNNMGYVLSYFADCGGLILDVRSNGGGSLEYAKKLAATFFETNTVVGYMQHKTGTAHDAFSDFEAMEIDTAAMSSRWLRPLVVLCNRRSYSATNFFVNAMRYAPNTTIMGGITGGGGGMPLSYELPNGWLVRLSSVPMYNADKESIEAGVEPDIYVNTTDESAAQGKDDIIEAAVAWLLK